RSLLQGQWVYKRDGYSFSFWRAAVKGRWRSVGGHDGAVPGGTTARRPWAGGWAWRRCDDEVAVECPVDGHPMRLRSAGARQGENPRADQGRLLLVSWAASLVGSKYCRANTSEPSPSLSRESIKRPGLCFANLVVTSGCRGCVRHSFRFVCSVSGAGPQRRGSGGRRRRSRYGPRSAATAALTHQGSKSAVPSHPWP